MSRSSLPSGARGEPSQIHLERRDQSRRDSLASLGHVAWLSYFDSRHQFPSHMVASSEREREGYRI